MHEGVADKTPNSGAGVVDRVQRAACSSTRTAAIDERFRAFGLETHMTIGPVLEPDSNEYILVVGGLNTKRLP